MFSETAANYKVYCHMRFRINNLDVKITRQQKNLETVNVNAENTDLKAKICHV
jgi:hypothetical protein